MGEKTNELLGRAMAGQDLGAELGEPTVVVGPIATASSHPDGEVMVGRSLRLPLDTAERIRTAAQREGVAMSAILRRWIDAGLAESEAGVQPDPVIELRRASVQIQHALGVLEAERRAA